MTVLTREDLLFTEHAVDQMAERGILLQQVLDVLTTGVTIESYPDDTPYPSALVFAMVSGAPLHVLRATHPATGKIIVITTYVPDDRWNPDFRTRKKPL